MRPVLLLICCMLVTACGTASAGPEAPAAARQPYDQLMGRWWIARTTDSQGRPKIGQRLEFVPGLVRRVVFDPEFAGNDAGKLYFKETELPLTVTGSGKGFILIDIAGGKDVWRIVPVSENEIRIGGTTFVRGDAEAPPNAVIKRQ